MSADSAPDSTFEELTTERLRQHTAASNAHLREQLAQQGPRVPGEPRSWFELMDDWVDGLQTPFPDPTTAA